MRVSTVVTRRWLQAGVPVVLLALCGCQAAAPKATGPLLFFPSPPEKPRVQFLTWATGANEVEPGKGKFEDFVLGQQPVQTRAINKPYGIAVRDGAVYVCDTKGLCITKLDFKQKTYSVFGDQGLGRLRKPLNIVIDQAGNKFVVDSVRKQIVVFGPTDQYATAFNVPEPCRPVDVAVSGEELFVLDNDDTCEVVVLDRTSGAVLRKFGGPGTGPGQFRIPNSIGVSGDGHVYVSDTHNFRIQKLTRDGKPVAQVGIPGYRLGQFGRPRGIRVGPDGVVYVVDGATELVQMFDAENQSLMRFGGPGDMAGAMILPATLAIDTTSIPYFKDYIHRDFNVKYLIFVTNQYGSRLVNVYAFGEFPEGYQISESQVAKLPPMAPRETEVPGEGGRAEAPEPNPQPATQPAGHR
ncbi:MAG: hypothetical protein HZB38_10250 [Planctomycetes bacterium]|nr:hypothetical protein [Planctomycetota bacterium]